MKNKFKKREKECGSINGRREKEKEIKKDNRRLRPKKTQVRAIKSQFAIRGVDPTVRSENNDTLRHISENTILNVHSVRKSQI
jgi:hypothetical protein